MGLRKRYEAEKERYLQKCTRCGLCAKGCPILRQTDLAETAPGAIQQALYTFFEEGKSDTTVSVRALSCMACFKCTRDMCPEGLDPMMMLELARGELIRRKATRYPAGDAGAPDSDHRILAAIQTTPEAYARITTIGDKSRARRVFFPGCNVYHQPEKILSAMDILDTLGEDWVLLPGLDHCCGDRGQYPGDIVGGAEHRKKVVAALAVFEPEEVLLWCPTCHCRFQHGQPDAETDLPFALRSFPQYLAANMQRLPLKTSIDKRVTLHEACKSVYTGVDREGPRGVLEQLPGVTLLEMASRGRDTVCCGSGAGTWFPDSADAMRQARLEEAQATGADELVTVCHYCNGVFAAAADRYSLAVSSYVSLVAEAMGIRRKDRYATWLNWQDADRILEDAGERVRCAPFSEEAIRTVVRRHFCS
jgi:heterodisulfide reductase subunit D